MKKISLNLNQKEIEMILIELLDKKLSLLREREDKGIMFGKKQDLEGVNGLIQKVIYQIQKSS